MNILQAVEARGLAFKKVAATDGGEYKGPCPVCGGEDRFMAWPNKEKGRVYWCRHCGIQGDLIQFYRDVDGLGYKQACAAAGCEAKAYPYSHPAHHHQNSTYMPRHYESPAEAWALRALKFVTQCHESLMDNREALAKLERERGLTADTAERFLLGLNPQDFYRSRESWGLPTVIKANGKPKKLWIPRGLVIPYMVDGRVRRIRVRRPDGDLEGRGPKYYFVPGSSAEAMLIDEERDAYVVVESELDAILIRQDAGDLVGVVSVGTATGRPDGRCHASIEKTPTLLIALDADEAGVKNYCWWRDRYCQAERLEIYGGAKDPGDLNHGVDLRAWVLSALPPVYHMAVPPVPNGPSDLDSPEDEGGDDIPMGVIELAYYLEDHPVTISKDSGRPKVHYPWAWGDDHQDISERIFHLMHVDLDVVAYIDNHPAKVIDGKNILAMER